MLSFFDVISSSVFEPLSVSAARLNNLNHGKIEALRRKCVRDLLASNCRCKVARYFSYLSLRDIHKEHCFRHARDNHCTKDLSVRSVHLLKAAHFCTTRAIGSIAEIAHCEMHIQRVLLAGLCPTSWQNLEQKRLLVGVQPYPRRLLFFLTSGAASSTCSFLTNSML